MTFDALTRSRRRSKPVELYLFNYGPNPTDYFAFNDGTEAITYDEIVYEPFAFDRSAVNSSGSLDKSVLTVSTASNSPITSIFQEYPPTEVISLTIRQGQIDDPDAEFLVVWAGRVLSCQFTDSEAELTCEPVSTSLARAGLRRNYQIGCPLALYSVGDGMCNADKTARTTASTASAIDGAQVTLPGGWAADDTAKGKFRGGMLEWDNATSGLREKRTILRVNTATNVLTLAGPVRGLIVGQAVAVIAGCNHQLDDCETLHENVQNYGGQWLIPVKTPFRGTNNFF